ncbi:copper resistance protein CopC [Cellulomonas sp. JZ18]|uniref:copper resistance CopC family protein n=1 Tax=Cellulomonas sp. JZ18 TaxID=2654191 RepID=UPI0012D4A9CD|nr:copper resistance CopC family protein [Cellulomonas sp. JZ18]QGQ20643.1 copper resistance protein CopC [Cellulomonas sp. JZ18]
MRRSPHPSSAPELHARAATHPARGTTAVALLAALAAAFAALLLTAAPAAAHNALRSTDPADGATVETAPAQITLTFDQSALELGTEIVVTAADGTVVSAGAAQLSGTSVVQPLAEQRPAGAYRVDWRVTSADGHPITGTFGFTAGAAAGTATTTEPTADPTAAATAAPADATTPTPEASASASPSESVDTSPDMGGSGEAARDNYPGTVPWWVWVLLIVVVIGAVFTVVARKQRGGGDAPDRGGVSDGTTGGGGPRAG